MYNHTNPDLNTHAPIISQETYDVVMANAEVIIQRRSITITFLYSFIGTQCSCQA
jgi:hypothetical protein